MKDINSVAFGSKKDCLGNYIPMTRLIRRQANKYSKDYMEHKQNLDKQLAGAEKC